MGSGAQDWQSPIDISLQSLAEVITRDKFGALQYDADRVTKSSMVDFVLASASGQGRLLFASVHADGFVSANQHDKAYFKIDNQTTYLSSFAMLADYDYSRQGDGFKHLFMFDMTDYDFGVSFYREVTFESSFEFRYNLSVSSLTIIDYEIAYTLL